MNIRNGYLQLPVILEVPVPYTGAEHRATGVRCPRCCQREIVYNGNYFCAGFDSGECRWALPHADPLLDPETGRYYDTDPHYLDLEDVLIPVGCHGGRRGSKW